MFARIVLMIFGLVSGAVSAQAQSADRIVALVVTVGDGSARADVVQTQLQVMGAETLRAEAPTNAELRSILTRFAREAANARATFVYLDAPAVNFENRAFVLPAGAKLNRATDIFTQAIPLQAFSRSAAQAGQGGAVVATILPVGSDIPSELTPLEKAPGPVAGSTPVLTTPVDGFPVVLATLEEAANQPEIEVGKLLRRMTIQDDITVSDFPKTPIFLREPPKPEIAPEQVALPEPTREEVSQEQSADQAQAVAEPKETEEELTLLEQSLSRAAKRSIQRSLRDLGFYKGLVDGIFGPQTRGAIEAFQESRSEDQTGLLNRRQLLDLTSS